MSADLAAEWLVRADADIDAVERCLSGSLPNIIVACFHCQQAAEKLVKALLVAEDIRHPRGKEGHDIGLCASRLPDGHPLKASAVGLDVLTDWATVFRYPSDDPDVAEPLPEADEVRERLNDIRTFRVAVMSRLAGEA